MNSTENNPPLIDQNNEVDINIFLKLIWDNKIKLIVSGLLAGLLGVFISLSMPNIYKAEAVLSPVESDSGNLSNTLSSLGGGLGALASVGMSQSASKTDEGVHILGTYDFFVNFISNNNGLPELMASKKWDKSGNKIIYDESIFNPETREWIPDKKPSLQEAYRKYIGIFGAELDTKTGFVKLELEHHSPYIAEDWLKQIISQINDLRRFSDVEKAEKSIFYLDEQINSTYISEVKVVISDLIQNQIQTVMLAKSSPEYLFSVLQQPIPPELKSKPKRALICIAAAFLGGLICFIYILYKKGSREKVL